MPLKLRIEAVGEGGGEKEFARGISAGMGRSLIFLLPKGCIQRFKVLVGLNHELGKKGKVVFTIVGDGKELISRTHAGVDPAAALECDVSGLAQIEFKLETARDIEVKLDAKNN